MTNTPTPKPQSTETESTTTTFKLMAPGYGVIIDLDGKIQEFEKGIIYNLKGELKNNINIIRAIHYKMLVEVK